jgi:MFS family permease
MAMISVMVAASRSLGALPSGFIADNLGYEAIFFVSSGIALGGGLLVLLGLRNIRSNSLNRSDDSQLLSQGPTLTPVRFIYRHLAWQCVVAVLQFLGLGILMTFLPLLATEVVGVSAVEVGILFTTGGLVAVVSGIPMGMLADRVGKKVFMVIGMIVSASAIVGMVFITSFHGLLALVIVRSLGMVMFSPAALGLLSEFVPTERQSTVMGVYGGICENTGLIAGSALGGVLWSTLGYRTTFLAAAASAGLGALICLTLVKARSIDSPSSSSPVKKYTRGNRT